MTPSGNDDVELGLDRPSQAHAFADAIVVEPSLSDAQPLFRSRLSSAGRSGIQRRTPRVSVIVVLPENHVVSPERLAHGLRPHENQEVDIVVACAGQPTNLTALQRCVGKAHFLLAPAGTSTQDLRELAMRQAPGDIVTLLSGELLRESPTTAERLALR